MPVYEVLALEHPTKKEAEDGKLDKLLWGPDVTIARDSQNAMIIASTEHEVFEHPERTEVLCRPF